MRFPAVLAAALLLAAHPATAQPASPPSDAAPAPDDTIPVPPVPPRISNGDQYDACMDMLADDPAGADAMATAWRNGGDAATQCHALAQIELGNPAEGADLLTNLANTTAAEPAARAELYGQAAQAWTMAGDTTRAYDAANHAIALAPEDPDLRVTHAIAALAVHQDQAAEDDLTEALEADPKRGDALVLRATARRHLGRLQDAAADIAKALALDPDAADALLERGILRQREGNLDGARADWQRAEDLSPDSATGDLAAQNLALLEAGPRQ
ncbi:MAG TPA: tetratricopeptide repeat protein [Acetobacteraceae bacterium]|nr:tetratricopeptide repeat protein [Acetobacteraceae bacterium]